jgi:hypothetical protein
MVSRVPVVLLNCKRPGFAGHMTFWRQNLHECLCKLWTNDPERFTMNPIQKMPGLNTFTPLPLACDPIKKPGAQKQRRVVPAGIGADSSRFSGGFVSYRARGVGQ